MARTKGSTNVKPTKQALKSYYAMLRSAADQGDLMAAGKLIELHHMDSSKPPKSEASAS
ncbi:MULTISPECIES: hypothetical protein [Marinobacter]|uniref:hypothetical protein n=1 Tax=Marinobacter TaxID=2742 RepID=UPI001B1602E4|nr:hypothetical protein [Marinobacter sp.]MBO6811715.1 hypothetical protein [Marinobacter sp.]MBO6875056.1 hypothetical protein [Marinobacter sp.]